MKRKVRSQVAVVFLLVLAISSLACKETNRALVLARDAAVTSRAVFETVQVLHRDNVIDDSTYRGFLENLDKIQAYNVAAVTALQAKDTTHALTAIDGGITIVDQLLSTGIVGIKDENKKVAVQAILLSFRGALITAKALLQT